MSSQTRAALESLAGVTVLLRHKPRRPDHLHTSSKVHSPRPAARFHIHPPPRDHHRHHARNASWTPWIRSLEITTLGGLATSCESAPRSPTTSIIPSTTTGQMPLTKSGPSPSHGRSSPAGKSSSRSGFHPFGGRVSKHFGETLSPDDAYLSYHDVRLTREDVSMITTENTFSMQRLGR